MRDIIYISSKCLIFVLWKHELFKLETKTNSELLYRAEKFIIWFLDQLEYIKYNSLQAVYEKGELVIHKKLTLLNANTTNRVISSGRLWNIPCETSNFLKYFTITAQCCPLCQFKVFIKFLNIHNQAFSTIMLETKEIIETCDKF